MNKTTIGKVTVCILAALLVAGLAGCGRLRRAIRNTAAPAALTTQTPATHSPAQAAASEPSATPTRLPTRTPMPTETPFPTPTPWPTRRPQPTATPWLGPSPTASPAPATPTAAAVAARPAPLPGRLALQVASGGPIYVVGADGQGLRQVTHGLDPAWSPDGKRLAVVRLDGEQRGVYAVNVDGSGEELLYGWSQLRWPAWSADGATVVFSRQNGGKEERTFCVPRYGCFTFPGTAFWRLGEVNVADHAFRDVPSDQYARSPALRADGTIVYIGEQGVQASSLNGDALSLLREEAKVSSPAISPDGQRIVYMVRLHDHEDLFLMNAGGANPVQLTRSSALAERAASNVAPAWSPDGKSIAFLSDRDGPWRLYIMNADGSNQRPFLAEALAGLELHYDYVDERAIAWGK